MLATVFAVLLFALALLLFAPLELDVDFESGAGGRRRLAFRWLFGLVRAELGGERQAPGAPPEHVEKPRPVKQRRRGRRRHVLAMLHSRGFLRGLIRLMSRLARAFRFRSLTLHLRAGLDDPADTGLLCAGILPVTAWLEMRFPGKVEFVPDFTGEALDAALDAEVDVTAARLVGPLLLFGLAPSTLFGLLALRTGRAR